MPLHTVTVKDDVFEGLKVIRYELSSTERLLTYNEAIGELVKLYQANKAQQHPHRGL